MKKVLMTLFLTLLLCLMVNCRNDTELEVFKAQAALEEANKALAVRYIDAMSKADVEAIKAILSPNYVHHPQLGRDESLEEALSGLEQRVTMFPDQSFSIDDMIVKGDKIAWRGVFRGTHMGDIEGFPATGKAVEMGGFQILRVQNGKIAEAWGCRELLSLYEQLGFELIPKE